MATEAPMTPAPQHLSFLSSKELRVHWQILLHVSDVQLLLHASNAQLSGNSWGRGSSLIKLTCKSTILPKRKEQKATTYPALVVGVGNSQHAMQSPTEDTQETCNYFLNLK